MLLFLSALLLLGSSIKADDIEVEDGVLVLTTDNFQTALDANTHLLVEFYAPWCGHCKTLAPEYSAAAGTLASKSSSVKLAKVDATENKEIATKFGVKGYPTLKWFKNGEAQEYTGGRTADTIVSWITKKTQGLPSLDTEEAANTLVADNKVTVIGFFKDSQSKEAEAFAAASNDIEDVVCAMTSTQAVFNLFKISSDAAVIVLKKFDEGRNELEGDITVDSVTTFVMSNMLPLVVDFNTKTAKAIFQGAVKNHLLMFLSAEDPKFEYIMHSARKIAKDYKNDVMFVAVTTDEEEHKKVTDFFGIKSEEVPTFRVTSSEEADMVKYKPDDSSLTEENLRAFLKRFKAGELQAHLKSQEQPEDWNTNAVKVLVSNNFAEVALAEGKEVFVEFYAPWCGHCKKLAPIWDELGEHFADNENVVIAKIDMTENELTQVQVRGFPTIKLFKADNTIVDYSGGRAFEDFVKFLSPKTEEEEEIKAKTEL